MADYTFFTQPMSRGQIARWALHEAGADYEHVIVNLANRPPELLKANPMGKVPAIIHHDNGTDRVVTEGAAICHYLAEMHPQAGLLPHDAEMADYFRWLFFAAGPLESAIVSTYLGFAPSPDQEKTAGWGSYDRTMGTLEAHLSGRQFIAGNRFTMTDVYVGSQLDWGLNFGSVPPNEAFVGYVQRLQARDAYKAAKAIDNRLIEESRK
ncbi:MAG: glutathione S-transferase family protein [Novosphingobium sp.]